MDNKEAIEWLKAIEKKYIHGGDEGFDEKRKEAIAVAIKALSGESTPHKVKKAFRSTDIIFKDDVLAVIEKCWGEDTSLEYNYSAEWVVEYTISAIYEIDAAVITGSLREVVSRREVIDAISVEWLGRRERYSPKTIIEDTCEAIKGLPSAIIVENGVLRHGRWKSFYQCPICDEVSKVPLVKCPVCGETLIKGYDSE